VDEALTLSPAETRRRSYPSLPADRRYTVEVKDGAGRVLLAHTEGLLDAAPAAEVRVGPQPGPRIPPRAEWTEDDILERGRALELEGKRLPAWQVYEEGRARCPPGSTALLSAAGRLAVDLKRFDEAVPLLGEALARDTTDAEAQYALGLALAARGEDRAARPSLEAAAHFRATRAAALLQLAGIDARAGDLASARARLEDAVEADPDAVRAGAMEVIVLRRMGRTAAAARRLAHWRTLDPLSAVLRNEAVRAGAADEALWRHLAGDPQRVLEAAVDYMELGAYDDALLLLDRRYSSDGVVREAGMPLPQDHAEVAYYRATGRDRWGLDARADFAAASRRPTTYVFPQRAQTLTVLRRAIEVDSRDATARFLLGALHLSGGLTEEAIADWEAARALDPRIPVLHRNLGRALIHAGQYQRAREVLAEGVAADPRNVEVYMALDQALGLLGRPPTERAAALRAYPDPAAMPPSLVLALAVAYVEAKHFDEAEALLRGRFFPREEFGTNVRQAWIEARLQRALALARSGRADEARGIVRSLGEPVPGLDFTRSGLPAFLGGARVRSLAGEILEAAGDSEGARRAFQAAAKGADAYPSPDAAFALLAARRLGTGEAEARARLEAALASWRNRAAVGTNYPGANAAGQGVFLRALGRDAEADATLREALLLPDKVMSHYLSRRALAGTW
jgi:tetratricopeptide (TPR) repeat protein